MDEVIKSYLESSEPFNRFFGENGLVKLSQSSILNKLYFEVTAPEGYIQPLDADDLGKIGAVFMNLAEALRERDK